MDNPNLHYIGLLPEISLALVFVVVLIADLFLAEERKRSLTPLAVIGTSISFATVVFLHLGKHHSAMAEGTYVVDGFALVAKGLFLACGALVMAMGTTRAWKGEYLILILASLLGMVMMPSSRDLITFFVAFELLAIPGYLLVGWRKKAEHGHEAALKYYLLGVLATAFMLYGLSLLFGIAGGTTFSEVARALQVGNMNALASLAVLFVMIGMGFKVAAVPFHFWAPDVYEGAPLPVAAFLAVVSKAAGMVALALFVGALFPSATEVWAPFLFVVATLTMTVGNLVALRQTDFVRLLAWSSIAQAGFLLVPLAVIGAYGGAWELGAAAMFDYLIIYAVSTFAAFSIVAVVSQSQGSTQIAAFRGLFARRPGLAIGLAIALLSLAGIPPLGGWFAKFMIFNAAIEADSGPAFALAVIAALNTALSVVYYAQGTRQLWLPIDEPLSVKREETAMPSPAYGLRLLVVAMPIFAVVTGVLPGVVTVFGGASSLGI